MSQELVVIAVDDPMKAQEMLMAAGRLGHDGKLDIDDAVIITKSSDGHHTHKLETTDLTPAEGGYLLSLWVVVVVGLTAGMSVGGFARHVGWPFLCMGVAALVPLSRVCLALLAIRWNRNR